ncbi:MAG: prolyl oligopeptidase family serine peptidase [Chitinophagaceae bacterium]
MRKLALLLTGVIISLFAFAQQKPLNHSVYDGWQNIGERAISNDGRFVVYTITPQEGDGVLVIQATDNSFKKEIPRGYNASITEDSRFIVFRIAAFFKDTREARINKKTPDQMPKDSLGILEFGKNDVLKIPRVKSYKVPEKNGGWLAYNLEKALPDNTKPIQPDSLTRLNNIMHMADSLIAVADSLRNKANEAKTKGLAVLRGKETKPLKAIEPVTDEGTDLIVRNLSSNEEKKYKLVSEYYFSKKGNALIIETTRKTNDTLVNANIVWLNTATGKLDTVMRKFNDAKNYAIDEDGTQLAFVAERDSVTKALQKFYKLWFYKPGMDSAQLKADKSSAGIDKGYSISADYRNNFSKNSKKLFFGIAPVRPPKDTTLAYFETAGLDIWNYKDDYIQPEQLVKLNAELKRSYLAVINDGGDKIIPLADENCENIMLSDEGNGLYALGRSTKGYRVELQWNRDGKENLYVVNTQDGSRKRFKDEITSLDSISPLGNFMLWYDWKLKNWFTYQNATGAIVNITKDIKTPLFDEEDDHPDYPPPHGFMAWQENDKYVYIYDRYDIWKCDPTGKEQPVNFTNGYGRKHKLTYRYIMADKESRYIKDNEMVYLDVFDEVSKKNGLAIKSIAANGDPANAVLAPATYRAFRKAKNSSTLIFTKESFDASPDIYAGTISKDTVNALQLSAINPQQKEYNWMTVDLLHWKMFDGKISEGLVYKPANFDSTKKYPVIFYFYERNADTRYNYKAPAPSASIINIPYYVSNGYIVFDPNIYYKTGQPGEDAYNSVISAAKFMSKFKWVDTTKLALEGHSWGGYQVAYLVTRTNIFAAAEAGAPVANMTSAYSGIRWGTGISRQFQYEHTQSRLGASLWQKPELYFKNSPLFRADKINTPLLIMHNDADGAVPWYQGIELFSALRRLNKKVWMMQYNGEDHGLQERRNRKDWSIRMAQFFDHYLKGEPEPKWMEAGVPATLKGIDWGLKE